MSKPVRQINPASQCPSSRSDEDKISEGALRVAQAQCLLSARQYAAKLIPKEILHDSTFDMLLELFVKAERGQALCVKQLVLFSGESSTAALRRIDRLAKAEMIQRYPDPADRRRVLVRLTEHGRTILLPMLGHFFLA